MIRKRCRTDDRSQLGMNRRLTRRDFLNATLLGSGSALLTMPAPSEIFAANAEWNGYGGVGDYANSNGNTWEVMSAGHQIRDGRYDHTSAAPDTGEVFDLVVVGGGLSGLGAAYYFAKQRPKQTCLVLENHPVFGGEAKQNEFMVRGQHLIAPQGSNNFAFPQRPGGASYELFAELGLPHSFEDQIWDPRLKPLVFAKDNYGFQFWADSAPSFGYFFDEKNSPDQGRWVYDIWGHNLAGTPFPEKLKRDLLTWRTSPKPYYEGQDAARWLDSMTYKDYLEKVMGLHPGVTRYADPIMSAAVGLGCDVTSAYAAQELGLPGFAFMKKSGGHNSEYRSFPGGNSSLARYFIKALIPSAIRGNRTFADILNGGINFDALDAPTTPTRVRLGSTAVRVEHKGNASRAAYVFVTYAGPQGLRRVTAKGVIMAGGSWTTRLVVRDLPEDYKLAYQQFHRSPMLVVNVALTNWRFLYKLGLTACRWFDGFGFCCNIRQPMIVGDYRPPLHPDKPTVLTFYVPFYYPGLPIHDQGVRGRTELFSTSYAEYERQIREQMLKLFGSAGFDPRNDIAGIIINRWGHAYLDPQPGFFFGREGKPAPRDVVRKRYGRIAFAHSEMNGHQNWSGAAMEGRHAMEQLLEVI